MPSETDKERAREAVARGVLSPAQANFVLRAIQKSESSGAPFTLREVLFKNRFVSPRRWEEFERARTDKAAPAAPAAPAVSGDLDLPPALPPPAPSEELALPLDLGGYRLTEKIGRGGMGTVYKAVQKGLRRTVALKVLSAKMAEDPGFVERFRQEARAAAALNHPNVVVPIAVDEDHGIHYLAMEYIEGESLAAWMEREGRLPWREAVEIVRQVARGLEHAHKLGLVHRDIKPDNILLDRPSGLAKIADLGLARRVGGKSPSATDGQLVGTPYYIAPEQARAEKEIDGRADLYSLGATLWHMLAGVPPFEGPSAAVIMTKHLTEPVPDPRTAVADCPEDLASVVYKMMAKDRFERYPNCTALCADLELLLEGKPVSTSRPGRREARERGGPPLALATGRAGPAGSRHRDPSGSRAPNPAVSRLRSPWATRSRDLALSRARGGGRPTRGASEASWLGWVLVGGAVLLAPMALAVWYQDRAEHPAPLPPAPETPRIPAKDPVSSAPKSGLPVEPKALRPPEEEREAEARKELRVAEQFAKDNGPPFDPAPAIARYERVTRVYPGTQAAKEAQVQAETLRQVSKTTTPKPLAGK